MSTNTAFQQRAVEKKRYIMDYHCWVEESEELSDFAVVVSPTTDPPLVASGAYYADLKIGVFIGGGKVGQIYLVSFIATTSLGQIKRDDLQMRIY